MRQSTERRKQGNRPSILFQVATDARPERRAFGRLIDRLDFFRSSEYLIPKPAGLPRVGRQRRNLGHKRRRSLLAVGTVARFGRFGQKCNQNWPVITNAPPNTLKGHVVVGVDPILVKGLKNVIPNIASCSTTTFDISGLQFGHYLMQFWPS